MYDFVYRRPGSMKEVVDALDSASEPGVNCDVHASALYRKHLIGVMAKRAVASALA